MFARAARALNSAMAGGRIYTLTVTFAIFLRPAPARRPPRFSVSFVFIKSVILLQVCPPKPAPRIGAFLNYSTTSDL